MSSAEFEPWQLALIPGKIVAIDQCAKDEGPRGGVRKIRSDLFAIDRRNTIYLGRPLPIKRRRSHIARLNRRRARTVYKLIKA